MNKLNTRREFIRLSAIGIGVAYVSQGLALGYEPLSRQVLFTHGVASGDPLQDRVILWTRIYPRVGSLSASKAQYRVAWEVALDEAFQQIVINGSGLTSADHDYTIKVDAIGLEAGRQYYYRFFTEDGYSPIGKTKTLPLGEISEVNLAAVSCSNYPAGYFNVYRQISTMSHLDALVHLGDYIYEYQRGGYASEHAADLGREVEPAGELLTLQDYRTRYQLYRSDIDLQEVHRLLPMIMVWDDHEICNDAWRDGAQNHQANEGDYQLRKQAALQAYAEWLPIRLPDVNENEHIYRRFDFGNLLTLHMLDTRIVGRDEPCHYDDYIQNQSIDSSTLLQNIRDPHRSLLGAQQRQWLYDGMTASTSIWQLLGQQVVMGRMYVPGAAAARQIHILELLKVGELEQREREGETLTADELTYLNANRHFLTWPSLPYNLDAWDGYEVERENILNLAKNLGKNLIVIAGDTHNAWANDIRNQQGDRCAVEFATASVSSPGLEYYINLADDVIEETEAKVKALITGLQYTNIKNRGFLEIKFTKEQMFATFHFVDTILSRNFQMLPHRQKRFKVLKGSPRIRPA